LPLRFQLIGQHEWFQAEVWRNLAATKAAIRQLNQAEKERKMQNLPPEIGPSGWSGRRESNPRMQLGKLPFYH
jgi:hypothetical protein